MYNGLALPADRLFYFFTSSSRMRVINHNWSDTKQRLHPQSVYKPPFSFVKGQDSTIYTSLFTIKMVHCN